MSAFYPKVSAVAKVQRWLLERAAMRDETFICRTHAPLRRGEWVPGDGANAYLTSDNEFATSVFGLTSSGNADRLTSGALLDALRIRGVKLCWALGESSDQREAVTRSHAAAGISPPPTGGTSLYRFRGEMRLKLAHLAPAADEVSNLRLSEPARRQLRLIRSVNPVNMFPLPRAGNRFAHAAEWRGEPIALNKRDLGETDAIIECLIALLEERYRDAGHAEDFAAWATASLVELESLDLPALRARSRSLYVSIAAKPASARRWEGEAELGFEGFKHWAREIVRQYGHQPVDYFVVGVPCTNKLTGGGGPSRHVALDGFEDVEYDTVYRVAKDTRVSALAYFLLLDERHHGDCNAIFRPDVSRTRGSLKPLLSFMSVDLQQRVVPHLSLHGGEIKGWNVLSADRTG
jgi:hypothetical protein